MTTQSDRDSEGRLAAATAKVTDVAGQARDAAGQAYGTAVERVGDAYSTARESAGDALATARDKAGDAIATARDGATDALALVREKAGDAYSAALDRATTASKATTDGLQANPMIALIGGLAVGAIAGALLPRSEREATLLAPLGSRMADLAKLAAIAAKDAGLGALGDAGISRDGAKAQIDKLLETALGAAKAASGAAADAVRKPE